MIRSITLMLGFALIPSLGRGEPVIVFGVDEGSGQQLPVEFPNAENAKQRFLKRLVPDQIGYQDFELLDNDGLVETRFPHTDITAQVYPLGGLGVIDADDFWTQEGLYPTSGDRFLLVDNEADTPLAEFNFSRPITALGFHLIDANDDFEGAGFGLQLQLTHTDGSTKLAFAESLGVLQNGSVAFVGVLSPSDPFDSVLVQWWSPFGDEGTGIDDLYVGTAVPEPAAFGLTCALLGVLACRQRGPVCT